MLSCMVKKPIKRNTLMNILTWRNQTTKKQSICSETMDKVNVRWAFNTSTWTPTFDQILAASSYIQPEEKQRISRFVFQDDAKSSLIGRLMLRKFVHTSTLLEYQNVCFGRDDRGKPYLSGIGDVPVNFNISHQGDYVVLGGTNGKNIGIDLMKIEPPANKNIQEFFRIMKRQFSDHEWKTIYAYPNESEQIACFYRMWCLKESYVKNIGLGITVALNEISFNIKSELKVGEITADTKLYVKNCLKEDWHFEETLLDEKHAVAVSFEDDKEKNDSINYEFLSYDDLVKEAEPLAELDSVFANDFIKKVMKPQ
ncbi:L-aminoadipate-semialdehyde dehydrogenase-phosphopantetheinyl transferase [Maniola jurtina]|uniref:L-aminoadipate-semialdehyde dehydrogenase-phosphopantetheinyl transferase n=1 Tax=Maniola jurtina TaxID=191418 RepID=UPI001E68F2A0|nr:L-aminoadipate-semialdehyde dehydrogenase-phosphopantetheinyl transferase [Maniola jurtina]